MQPSQTRPPLPPNVSKQTSQQNIPRYQPQTRVQMDRNSSAQSSGNLLAIHPQNSVHKSCSMQSMQSIGSSDSNFCQQEQQNQNYNNYQQQQNYNNYQQPNPNVQPQASYQSSQPVPNKDSVPSLQQEPSGQILPGQIFRVVYNNTTYMVNPIELGRSSLKFRELIMPYIRNTEQMKALFLEVRGNQFTNRNMNNFLRLCQHLPTDVQNCEMEEICEIAKMFNAEQIYNTGLSFIKQNLDSSFNVPDNKYDGSDGNTYLIIDDDHNAIHHDEESDAYFEDANDNTYQGNYYKINDSNNNNNSANQEVVNSSQPSQNPYKQNKQNQDNEKPDLESHAMLHDPVYGLDNASKSNIQKVTSNNENVDVVQSPNDTKEDNKEYENMHSVVYIVRVENHTIKCPAFKFVRDNRILYSAKQKYSDIYIAEGGDIHIRNKQNHVAHITQDDVNYFNTINTANTHFQLKYVDSGKPGHLSMEVSFPFKDRVVNWVPKRPRYDPTTDKYYLNFHGEYHHTPIRSSKNIVLQNKAGSPTFIVRKMDQCIFEIECLPVIDPLIVFCIGLSDIVGPYLDPWSNVDYFL